MKIGDLGEHSTHFYDNESEKPIIEIKTKKEKIYFHSTCNQVVFILQGKITYTFNNNFVHEAIKGQILFLPVGERFISTTIEEGTLVILRIHEPINLYINSSLEKLYSKIDITADPHITKTKQLGNLIIKPCLWHYIEGINNCLQDNVNYHYWYEIKIKEFFLLIKIYYTEDELCYFLYAVLSGDTAFSEHIRSVWKKYKTVGELASSMHMTHKHFTTRFTAIFGKTPQKWMRESKALIISREIIETKKPFKQIAIEYGFTSDALFTHFCKNIFRKSPTQIRKDGNNHR